MLRTLVIATALLAASGAALARDTYDDGRVVFVEPHVVVSFGTRHDDGFRAPYESGGSRHWTHTRHYPGYTVLVPPSQRVMHVRHYRDHGHGWDKRRGRDDRHGWRDDRREHRGERGHGHRRHHD